MLLLDEILPEWRLLYCLLSIFFEAFPLVAHRSPIPSGAPSKLSAGSVDGQLAIHALSDPKTSHRLTRYKPLVARARAGKFWEICWMQTGRIKEIKNKQTDLFSFESPSWNRELVDRVQKMFEPQNGSKWWFPPYLWPLPMDMAIPPPVFGCHASQVSRQGANS